jgi:hypothetical protein
VEVRWRGLSAPLLLAVMLVGPWAPTASAEDSPDSGQAGRVERLEIYYTPPVLVREGEKVLMPLHVVCATKGGRPCRAKLTLATRAGPQALWVRTTTEASGLVLFDLTSPAARAVRGDPSGRVSFYLRATARGGGPGPSVSVPDRAIATPLSFYVTRRLPVLRVPTAPFGRVRKGAVALSLSWGSGPTEAGIELGRESATLGPSSFDVDRNGAIHLVDAIQDRIAVFSGGKLVKQARLPLGPGAAIAVTDRGVSYVTDREGGEAVVRRIDPAGRPGPPVPLGEGIPSQVRTMGERAFVHLLPLDAWVPVSAEDSARPRVGMPVDPDAELLRVGREEFVRLGFASNDRVSDAIELRFDGKVGDVPLAERDDEGGFVAVVHVWRDDPPADQFQVVRATGGGVLSTFAVSDSRFADTPPLSRFRVGRDGHLYQLTTSPRGIRILRFDMREGS